MIDHSSEYAEYEVNCDTCSAGEVLYADSLRELMPQLTDLGWLICEGMHLCPACAEDQQC